MLNKGERWKYAGKKVCLNRVWNSQPPGHEFDMLTTEPSWWETRVLEFNTVSLYGKKVFRIVLHQYFQCFDFYVSTVQVFRKHCGKRRNCLYRAISPYPTMFSIHWKNFLPFSSNLILLSANSFSLNQSKILLFGKGLKSDCCYTFNYLWYAPWNVNVRETEFLE